MNLVYAGHARDPGGMALVLGTALDPLTCLTVSALLIAAAVRANYLPARLRHGDLIQWKPCGPNRGSN